jgi:hypothetical protein
MIWQRADGEPGSRLSLIQACSSLRALEGHLLIDTTIWVLRYDQDASLT